MRSSALCADRTRCSRTCAEMPEAYHHRQLRYTASPSVGSPTPPQRWVSLAAAVSAKSAATESDSHPRPAPFSSRVPARPRPLGPDYHRFVLVFVSFIFFFSPFLPSFSITRKTGMRVHHDPNNVAPTTRPS